MLPLEEVIGEEGWGGRFFRRWVGYLLLGLFFSCGDSSLFSKFNRETNPDNSGIKLESQGKVSDKDGILPQLRIAILVPTSGPVRAVGESIVDAAQLAMFTEPSVPPLRLRIYDTQGTVPEAIAAFKRALEDGVDVVLGPLFKAETKALQPLARQHKLLLFSLSSEEDLVNLDNVFVTGSFVEHELQTLISYLLEKEYYNYVAFLPNTSFGASSYEVLRRIIEGKDASLMKADYYGSDDPKMLAKLVELISFHEIPQTIYESFERNKLEKKLLGETAESTLNVQDDEKIYSQAIFLAEGGKTAAQIANLLFSLRRSNREIQIIGTSKLDGDDNTLKNPYLNGAIFVGANPEAYEKYSNNFFKIYGHKPLKITSMVYDLLLILGKVYQLDEEGHYKPDKMVLLDPQGFDGIDGRFRFLPNGLVERRLHVLQFNDGEKIILDTNQEFLNY